MEYNNKGSTNVDPFNLNIKKDKLYSEETKSSSRKDNLYSEDNSHHVKSNLYNEDKVLKQKEERNVDTFRDLFSAVLPNFNFKEFLRNTKDIFQNLFMPK